MLAIKSVEILLFLLALVKLIVTIVNPNNETAGMVIYLQKPNDLGPRTWLSGIDCLDQFAAIYLRKREKLTRSPNLVLSIAANMTTPAAQIQEGFLKLMMEAVSEIPPKHKHFQIRIISDSKVYLRRSMTSRELLLSDYYVIIIDSVKRLKNLMRNYVSRMLSWNPGARFLILYNNANNRNESILTARKIFEEMLYNFYVHRVVVMYATTSMKYSVLLMDYFNVTSCRQLRVKSFATCEEGAFIPNSAAILKFQLQKFSERVILANCTFYVCASISAPFIEADCINGLELQIIDFIKEHLKFDIEQTCEYISRGVEENPGNWTGLLAHLNHKSCDFIVGGFFPDNDIVPSFWVSDPYLRDSYTWFVKLAQPRPPWMALYTIFQHLTWLTCLGMLLLTWITWYILVNFLSEPLDTREFSLVGINNMAVTICSSVNDRPICAASRIFFVFLALYGLTLTSTYTSKLISVFSHPGFLHQIDTLQEVKALGIPYGGHEESRDWFENEEDMWIFRDFNKSEDFHPTSANLEYVRRGDRVILSSRMYLLQNPLSDAIYGFPYNVFLSQVQMIMKPGFPFLYEFNWMIRYMRDFGFFDKIHNDFVYINTYLNRIAKMRPDFEATGIVLTPEHLQGSFEILALGMGISIISFIGELLTFYIIQPRWKRHQKPTSDSVKTFEQKLKKKKERRDNRNQKQKLRQKLKKNQRPMPVKVKGEIVVNWSDRNHFDEAPIQKGIRFTPLNRRIIENPQNIPFQKS